LAAVTAVLLASAAALVLRAAPWRGPVRWLALALVLVAAVRFLVVSPSFVHASLHAPGLIEGMFDFPSEATHRASYGQYGLLAMDVYAVERRASALVLCVAASVLLVHTRQTYFLWVPLTFLAGLARSRSLLRDARFWIAASAAGAATAQRLAATVATPSEQM